ncbi:MAG: hypothetical protein ACYDGN_11070 [Acidimicrobiales bacterium]
MLKLGGVCWVEGRQTKRRLTTGTYRVAATMHDSPGASASERLGSHVAPDASLLTDDSFTSGRPKAWHLSPATREEAMHTRSGSAPASRPLEECRERPCLFGPSTSPEADLGSGCAGGPELLPAELEQAW